MACRVKAYTLRIMNRPQILTDIACMMFWLCLIALGVTIRVQWVKHPDHNYSFHLIAAVVLVVVGWFLKPHRLTFSRRRGR